jgi:C1A family cysteine protease
MRTSLVAFALALLTSHAGAQEGLLRTDSTRRFLLQAPRVSFTQVKTPVPGRYSMRGKIGPVEDQGSCHACWAFAMTTALRGTLAAAGHDPGRLSFNYMLNCNSQGFNCSGGDFTAADLLVKPQGPPAYGADGEYTENEGTCQRFPVVASAPSYKLLGTDFNAHPGAPEPTFKDIAYVVGVLHKPVAVDVAADWGWNGYSSGTFTSCSGSSLNHMVVIEGYSCESSVDSAGNCVFGKDGNLPPGVGVWIVRNSHGLSYGDRGYITIKATASDGSKCNSIATDALFFD